MNFGHKHICIYMSHSCWQIPLASKMHELDDMLLILMSTASH